MTNITMLTDRISPPSSFEGQLSDADPFGAAFFDDPFPTHDALRNAGPVVWLERYGVPCVARYFEVAAVLKDWQQFSSASGVGFANILNETTWRSPSAILEQDPPEHTRARAVMQRVLSPIAMKALRESFMAVAEATVEAALDKGVIEAVTNLAEAYPLAVFPDALGMSREGREHILPFASVVFNAFGPDNQFRRSALATAAPHINWVTEQCREALTSEGFGGELNKAVKSGQLTEEEAVLLMRSLFSAGVDTIVSGLAAALYYLGHAPEQWQLLRRDPSLARATFEEAVRLESPV